VVFHGGLRAEPKLSASPPQREGDTFKLRETPKARVTNRRVKARRGPANSRKGSNTTRDATMDDPQPSPYSSSEPRGRFRDLTEVVEAIVLVIRVDL
jgi:hypothetical protein